MRWPQNREKKKGEEKAKLVTFFCAEQAEKMLSGEEIRLRFALATKI